MKIKLKNQLQAFINAKSLLLALILGSVAILPASAYELIGLSSKGY